MEIKSGGLVEYGELLQFVGLWLLIATNQDLCWSLEPQWCPILKLLRCHTLLLMRFFAVFDIQATCHLTFVIDSLKYTSWLKYAGMTIWQQIYPGMDFLS
jgi:hypothetical protein